MFFISFFNQYFLTWYICILIAYSLYSITLPSLVAPPAVVKVYYMFSQSCAITGTPGAPYSATFKYM